MSSISRFIYGVALLSVVIGFTTLAVIGYHYWTNPPVEALDCQAWLQEVIAPEVFEGVVVRVERVDSCEVWATLEPALAGRIHLCPCAGSQALFRQLRVGDTLRKRAGEQRLLLIEANSGRERTFDFPCCD